jgi:hypothetical protein
MDPAGVLKHPLLPKTFFPDPALFRVLQTNSCFYFLLFMLNTGVLVEQEMAQRDLFPLFLYLFLYLGLRLPS